MIVREGRFETPDFSIEIPEANRFPGPRPLVLLVGANAMSDLHGNGPAWPVRDSLQSLSRELVGRGFVTYRFRRKGTAASMPEILEHYRKALQEPRVRNAPVALLGVGEGADLIARGYYELYAARPPRAIVLLSTAATPIQLNNLTCPYFIVHGEHDPQFQYEPYSRVEEAVHHHQMRYGDLTDAMQVPQLGRALGHAYLSEEVVTRVGDWLSRATAEGKRPQEASAA